MVRVTKSGKKNWKKKENSSYSIKASLVFIYHDFTYVTRLDLLKMYEKMFTKSWAPYSYLTSKSILYFPGTFHYGNFQISLVMG